MIQQLRIYDINPALRNEFNDRFRDHASRIMGSYGFEIIAVWFSENGSKLEFAYILQWKDEKTMSTSWDMFMNDKEWTEIKAQTREKYGEMVLEKLNDQVLAPTDWFENKI